MGSGRASERGVASTNGEAAQKKTKEDEMRMIQKLNMNGERSWTRKTRRNSVRQHARTLKYKKRGERTSSAVRCGVSDRQSGKRQLVGAVVVEMGVVCVVGR